jgi:uncharacterized Zn finger protein (UPF0148 family)
MADLLRSGNTMLNRACPVCNNPIFRNKNGKFFCPTCNRAVLMISESTYQNSKTKKKDFIDNTQDYDLEKMRDGVSTKLKVVLHEKLDNVIQKLKNETQISDIEVYTRVLLNILEILDKIESKNIKL